jgi:hypothetical protein
MGRKHFKISENENDWRGFLYDLDCKNSPSARSHFVPGEITTKKTDLETVIEARLGAQTVITSNGADFVRFTVECQKRENNESCEDCWGLVILPNKEHVREYALRRADVKNGVWISDERFPWKALGYANLCVAVEREGNVRVSRFERCPFCESAYPLLNQDWYRKLPTIRAARRPK